VEEDVGGHELESGDFGHGASVEVTVQLGVSVGSLEGSPLGVRDGPSPLGSSGFDLALPGAELGAGEDTVSVDIVGVDDDSGVGGGEGADSNLELVEVEGAGVVPVEDAPVLGAEVVEEVLASLAHLDEAGDLGQGFLFVQNF